jgi:phosphoglycerate dehydrogenase-like enzyme
MAEYAALHILRLERQHEEQQAAARRCEWNDARDGEGRVHSSSDYRRLSSLTLGVLGLGDIGSGIARACSLGLRMNVIGCRRDSSPRASDAEAGVSKVFALSELAAFLAASDYIVSVLPSTPDTRGLLDGQVLAACAARSARGVALINVGRGDLLSETSILRAVDSGWLSHYVGDVFQVEPLPASSSLWRHPRVTVTPHNSAVTAPQDVATAFGDNLSRFVGGAPSGPDERFGPGLSGDAAMDPVGARARGVEALRNVFNWEAGY